MTTAPLRWLGLGRSAQRPIVLVRQLVMVGTIVRWAGLVVGGVIGLLAPPKASLALVLLILAVSAYNSWAMLAVRTPSEAGVLRIARAVTFLDEIGCLVFLSIFSHLTGGAQSAFYVPIVVEAVAFDRVEGAVISVVVFVLGITIIQGLGAFAGHPPFTWTVVLVWSLIMFVVGTALAALDLIAPGLAAPAEPPSRTRATTSVGVSASGPAVRLSAREEEVLRLIAVGYSNGMIARQLHLGETTVKTYVEHLLLRLSVKNRAEAVAAASRLGIL